MEITINSRPRQIDACLTLSDVMRDEGLYDKGAWPWPSTAAW